MSILKVKFVKTVQMLMHGICYFRDVDHLQRKRESRYTSKRVQPCSLLSLSGNLCYVPGESIVKAGRSAAEYKKVLTLGNGDVTIGLKVSSFRNALADGKVNTSVDTKNQPKHIQGKVWKNQVKQAVQSGEKTTPRSLLAKGLDPQDLISMQVLVIIMNFEVITSILMSLLLCHLKSVVLTIKKQVNMKLLTEFKSNMMKIRVRIFFLF